MIRCEEFNRYLDDPEVRAGAPLPGEAAAHAEECPACRALLDLLRAGPSPAVSYGVERRIRASLARSPEPVRPLAPAGAFVAATVAGLGVLAAGAGWLMGPAALRQPSPGQLTAMFVVLTAAAAASSLWLRRLIVPASTLPFSSVGLGFVVAATFIIAVRLLFPWSPEEPFLRRGIGCWAAGLMVAVPAAAFVLGLARRGVFLVRPAAGLTVGLLAGLAGAAALQLRCRELEAAHLAVWHTGILLTAGLAGWLAGHIAARRREIRP